MLVSLQVSTESSVPVEAPTINKAVSFENVFKFKQELLTLDMETLLEEAKDDSVNFPEDEITNEELLPKIPELTEEFEKLPKSDNGFLIIPNEPIPNFQPKVKTERKVDDSEEKKRPSPRTRIVYINNQRIEVDAEDI